MKILVIDDDLDMRDLTRAVLAREGIEVLDAASGDEGVRLAAAERPDLVMLDVMMPREDGLATFRRLRADPATALVPVLFVTALASEFDAARAGAAGAAGVLAKPFDPFQLVAKVKEAAGKRPAAAPPPAAGDAGSAERLRKLGERFVSHTAERIAEAEDLLARLTGEPGDRAALESLMRFFHRLAGMGTSYGFTEVSALGREGELDCMALLRMGTPTTWAHRERWRNALRDLRRALSRPPSATPLLATAPTNAELAPQVVLLARPELRASLERPLGEHGVKVEGLESADEVAARFAQGLPDGLLLDLGALPDGHGLLRRLKKVPGGEEVVVAVVGPPHADFLDRVEAIHAGADAFFTEPVDAVSLTGRLTQLLERQRPQPARILYMEDDQEQAEYVREVLEMAGHELSICDDPSCFEAQLRQFRPDLVLMDIVLPGVSGYDLARYVRQDDSLSAVPIVFLSTEGQLQARFRGARAGGDDHLVKPVPPAVLLSTVAARLERARSLRHLIEHDGLTRLLNHTAFLERAERLWEKAQREPELKAAWVMIDIDRFKSINDRYGHPVGDRVLAALSSLLRSRLRQTDGIGRYGGEEFAILLEELPEHAGLRLVLRLLEDFAALRHHAPDQEPFAATFSAGLAMLQPGMTVEEWKKAADDALYEAKKGGRNRIVASSGRTAAPEAPASVGA